MTMDAATLVQAVIALAPGAVVREKADRPAVAVEPAALPDVLARLKADERLAFDMLLDHTAVDWIERGRIELVYQLYSLRHGHYLTVTAEVPRDEPVAPSSSGVHRIAEWQEREVYDMFGVRYERHPDLRRLLLDDAWVGHPLRKDYRDDHMIERPK
jgi:NADH-quinone oxidoreductase subunit C